MKKGIFSFLITCIFSCPAFSSDGIMIDAAHFVLPQVGTTFTRSEFSRIPATVDIRMRCLSDSSETFYKYSYNERGLLKKISLPEEKIPSKLFRLMPREEVAVSYQDGLVKEVVITSKNQENGSDYESVYEVIERDELGRSKLISSVYKNRRNSPEEYEFMNPIEKGGAKVLLAFSYLNGMFIETMYTRDKFSQKYKTRTVYQFDDNNRFIGTLQEDPDTGQLTERSSYKYEGGRLVGIHSDRESRYLEYSDDGMLEKTSIYSSLKILDLTLHHKLNKTDTSGNWLDSTIKVDTYQDTIKHYMDPATQDSEYLGGRSTCPEVRIERQISYVD